MFTRASLPLAECVVVSERAHREFMDQSGLNEDLRSGAPGSEAFGSGAFGSEALGSGEEGASPATLLGMRLRHLSSPIEGELNRQICEALIALGASRVAVVSEDLTRRHLKNIPEVKGAIREAWLSLEGLGRQMEAASRGEATPTWPVFILQESAPY
jgi:hypothetical protein